MSQMLTEMISTEIVNVKRQPKSMLESVETKRQKIADIEHKLLRVRVEARRQFHLRKIEKLKAQIAKKENVQTFIPSVVVSQEANINIFKSIELYTIQVARSKSNSLIISGDAGVGKTRTVKDTIDSLGLIEDVDYYFATGTATTAGLYEILFRHRDKLIIFDDCDSVFKEPDSINILKGALDTYKIRKISKLSKNNTFDSTDMSEEDMVAEFEATNKLPNRFEFTGQIIFISNLPEDRFDKAFLSRSLHVDVHLSKQDLFIRMKDIMQKLCTDVPQEQKEEALDYLHFVTNNYPTKFDLNIRTLIHAINLRANNDETIMIADKEESVWKLLIKKYLIKIN